MKVIIQKPILIEKTQVGHVGELHDIQEIRARELVRKGYAIEQDESQQEKPKTTRKTGAKEGE